MNLPELYITEMKELLGDEYSLYEDSFSHESRIGIRVNRLKNNISWSPKFGDKELTSIPFIANGYFIDDKEEYTKHPYYFGGLYYVQEPSAMTPASMLNIDCNDKVLDLCAAPGGKTTELLSKGPAFLLANDISYSRTIPLVKNIELFGGKNYCVTAETPEHLLEEYPEYFDKILVDAPCSGEGMFRKDHSLITAWLNKGPADYCELQYSILSCAVKMLKPGGDLIYSTCTFSKCEDEEVIGRVLSENDSLEIIPLKHYDGFSNGFSVNKYPEIDFSGCIRLFPHKIEGEGHFICMLHKNQKISNVTTLSEKNAYNSKISKYKLINYDKLATDIYDFLHHVNKDYSDYKFLIQNDSVYLISESVQESLRSGLHYTRTGQLIGNLKNGKYFSPYSGYSLSLKYDEFDNILNLSANDERCIKYLKGETIFSNSEDDSIKKGFVMICVDNYPLGFSKYDGSKFKNLYTPGWRLNG